MIANRLRFVSLFPGAPDQCRIENQIDAGRNEARKALPGGAASLAYSPLPTDIETDPLDSASDLDLGPSESTASYEREEAQAAARSSHLQPPSASAPPVTVSFPTNGGSGSGSMSKARRREMMKRLGLNEHSNQPPSGRRPSITPGEGDDSDLSSPSTAPLRTWRSAPPTIRKQQSGALRRSARHDDAPTSDDDGPMRRKSGGIFG